MSKSTNSFSIIGIGGDLVVSILLLNCVSGCYVEADLLWFVYFSYITLCLLNFNVGLQIDFQKRFPFIKIVKCKKLCTENTQNDKEGQ